MDAIEQLKQDVREGRIGVDRLIDVIEMQQRQLQAALRRIEELEKKAGGSATTKVDEPFSMRAEEKRSCHISDAGSPESWLGRSQKIENWRSWQADVLINSRHGR